MQKSRTVVIYKPQEQDITALEKSCDEFNLYLRVCDNGEELRKEFEKQGVKCIIVPLGLEKGGRKAKEFAEIAVDILQPEDSDLVIIYSTEGYSPEEWLGEPDPRCTRVYHNYARPQLLMADKGWQKTIGFLKEADTREGLARNPFKHTVETEFYDKELNDTISHIPFPSEAGFLLRSAFKDMAKIVVHTLRQGLSGSMGYVIEPFNPYGQKTKKYFAKIYPDQGKALKEYENFRDYVYPCFPARHYPHYDYLRRYSGIAYSVIVSDMVEGPNGKSTTLTDIVRTPAFSIDQIEQFVAEALLVMDEYWKCHAVHNPINLIDAYIGSILKDTKKSGNLDAENSCNRWFGSRIDNAPFEKKLRSAFPQAYFAGTNLRICHGDLHLDNLMVEFYSGKLIPVFIDFSRTGETHSLQDLVTLESDLIIRGLRGLKVPSEEQQIETFFESLTFKQYGAESKKELDSNPNEVVQMEKVRAAIRQLRQNAISVHGASEIEYGIAALLKTMEVLSYGELPHDENKRAVAYVTYLCERIRRLDRKL